MGLPGSPSEDLTLGTFFLIENQVLSNTAQESKTARHQPQGAGPRPRAKPTRANGPLRACGPLASVLVWWDVSTRVTS